MVQPVPFFVSPNIQQLLRKRLTVGEDSKEKREERER